MLKMTIKEWELQLGIRLNNTNGFSRSKNKIRSTLYSKEQFRKGIQRSNITVMTEKGLEFLENFKKGLDR